MGHTPPTGDHEGPPNPIISLFVCGALPISVALCGTIAGIASVLPGRVAEHCDRVLAIVPAAARALPLEAGSDGGLERTFPGRDNLVSWIFSFI